MKSRGANFKSAVPAEAKMIDQPKGSM